MKELNIGDRVKIKNWDELPDSVKNADGELGWERGRGRVCGLEGEIVDKMFSEAYGRTVYRFKADGARDASRVLYEAQAFSPIEEPEDVQYSYEFEFLDNVVVAILYGVNAYGDKKELARGHGHIIHEGVLGVAQASSYALRKIWEKVEETN